MCAAVAGSMPGAVMTAMEGYPLAKQGRGAEALGLPGITVNEGGDAELQAELFEEFGAAMRNGLMMVFRTFERVSYALVLEIADGVKVGDRFTNP